MLMALLFMMTDRLLEKMERWWNTTGRNFVAVAVQNYEE